jgi:transcription initiation factor TFIID subunit 1
MVPGQQLSSINNNLFTSPVFEHAVKPTDFLLIRTKPKNFFYVREIPYLFTAGQVHPKLEVPAPGSRAAANYLRDRIATYILKELKDHSAVKLNDIMDAFPAQTEAFIRQRLRGIAEFQRGGTHSGSWTPKPDFRIPSMLEIQEKLKPEQVCAYESMEAAELELQKMGLDQLIMSVNQALNDVVKKLSDDCGFKEIAKYIEESLNLSPWNTTQNFILTCEGKALLQLSGAGNPLGRGEGFSFLRAPHRPEQDLAIPKPTAPRALTGTDKDLRKLEIKELRQFLTDFGVPESTIMSLSRWKLVGLLREVSSTAARSGSDTQFKKFARSERSTYQALRVQFKKNAQKIFERHCEVLSNPNPPKFDSRRLETENTDDELDDLARGLEMELEPESAFSRQYSDKIMEDQTAVTSTTAHLRNEFDSESFKSLGENESISAVRKIKKQILKRTVTTYNEDGSKHEDVKYIDDPDLLKAYMEDKADNGSRFKTMLVERASDIESKASSLPNRKTKLVRAIKKKAFVSKKPESERRIPKKKPPAESRPSELDKEGQSKKKKVITLICGACHQMGHTRQNKKCPARLAEQQQQQSLFQSLSEAGGGGEALEEGGSTFVLKVLPPSSDVAVSEEKKSVKATVKAPRQKRPASRAVDSEVVKKPKIEQVQGIRARGDPKIKFNAILTAIIDQLIKLDLSLLFRKKVNEKYAPGYYTVVKNPMYLELIRQRCVSALYTTIDEFQADIQLLVSNSETYNGHNSPVTVSAKELVDLAKNALELVRF